MLEWLTYQAPPLSAADLWSGCAWLLIAALICCVLEVTLARAPLRA